MPPAPPLDRDFDGRKAEGTRAEELLVDLLRAHGWTAYPNQIFWDAAGRRSAARAFGPDDYEWFAPDIDALTPEPQSQRIGIEVKSKVPRDKDGSIGWDSTAFLRAERWQRRTGAPVLYVIRDRSIAPLPADRSGLDTLAPWRFVSLHLLRQIEPDRERQTCKRDGEQVERWTWYWPGELFAPLAELLDGAFSVAPVLLRRTPPAFGAGRLL